MFIKRQPILNKIMHIKSTRFKQSLALRLHCFIYHSIYIPPKFIDSSASNKPFAKTSLTDAKRAEYFIYRVF